MMSQRLKIVEVAYNWPAETFIQRHVQALQSQGLYVQLIVRHQATGSITTGSLGTAERDIDAKILPNFNHLNWVGKLISLRFLTYRSIHVPQPGVGDKVLLGYFEHLKPDLIHFHDATLAVSMRWIPQALGIPYTLSLRGSDIQIFPLSSSAQKDATIAAIVSATKVHVVCQALGRAAAAMLGHDRDFSVIYTTLPIPSVLPYWRGISNETPIHFVSTGRLVWMKGFDNLLIALHSLCAGGLDVRLTIAGMGPDLERLLYLRKVLDLEEVVNFPGKLTSVEIRRLLQNAHAYIQASVSEGLSNSLVEAMANGLPVFATDIGGTNEVIEEGVSGFLLPPFAPYEWVDKLLYVRNRDLIEQVRLSAYEKALQYFSTERHSAAFESFFKTAVLPQNWQ